MEITNAQMYHSLLNGAKKVIQNREELNRINVFPVQDGDTGSNLASMMRSILEKSKIQSSVKGTLESVADAALYGARGNSGIIFAQYFRGLSDTIENQKITEGISLEDFVKANCLAASYAYEAVEVPVEGTMITLMREWGNSLISESEKKARLEEILGNAYHKVEVALEKTKEQLQVLKKAGVVDSGAKGFTYFVEGIMSYYKSGEDIKIETSFEVEDEIFIEETGTPYTSGHGSLEGFRYCTECLLKTTEEFKIKEIKEELTRWGDSMVIGGSRKICRVHIHTNEPAQVFEYLHEKGQIAFQKVDDIYRQETVVSQRKYPIALVTDSIADLPQSILDQYQVHVVSLDILWKDRIYLDKLTIRPEVILKKIREERGFPTSSQPNPKQVENLFDYLSTYYDAAVVLTVSKELSGTYNSFLNGAKKYKDKNFTVKVINTRQNSGAEGLLVKKCGEYIAQGLSLEEIERKISKRAGESKILVQVHTIDNMIKSGRLSIRAGKIAKIVGMKPVITLDESGKGALDSIAFSISGSSKKIESHMKKVRDTVGIEEYSIVHVNNLEYARELGSKITKLVGFEPVYIGDTSSIIAASAGDGAVAISYLKKEA